ncbi:hypothetical protein CROQUDRAFT_89949 [Cronartium quercuum f. sp. fusiforme G11]|uniref:Uncharacterized protein n=1 Tax=Cronartium quercuum f. sp. fusiforme G11 TaxID=708437 RepID=A0A9P6NMD6_9BASI|nr:hypothetical protein CROQUDRAFT_89949 [Cronartium quercuum f. sp. fusiforme G11]
MLMPGYPVYLLPARDQPLVTAQALAKIFIAYSPNHFQRYPHQYLLRSWSSAVAPGPIPACGL